MKTCAAHARICNLTVRGALATFAIVYEDSLNSKLIVVYNTKLT